MKWFTLILCIVVQIILSRADGQVQLTHLLVDVTGEAKTAVNILPKDVEYMKPMEDDITMSRKKRAAGVKPFSVGDSATMSGSSSYDSLSSPDYNAVASGSNTKPGTPNNNFGGSAVGAATSPPFRPNSPNSMNGGPPMGGMGGMGGRQPMGGSGMGGRPPMGGMGSSGMGGRPPMGGMGGGYRDRENMKRCRGRNCRRGDFDRRRRSRRPQYNNYGGGGRGGRSNQRNGNSGQMGSGSYDDDAEY
ncbi:hypothetical protein DMENIID0001_131050 [Sergentomyia squamirostris]